ncbi:hypothetical protein GZH47_32315 (plasmid) [Paenibacillus rhizovicinus]|uniref:Uncharacterized protein n=1 Tax=Paenibacillus rhizovicinus TaxID=2704463 RepID=A0A6C0PB20_9BACL|nr:hypothetical protein [Paenibacillus rhizovicinus]QHW35571.1 hypothetical protein GZH47_32315 [Paenibacillus rhizovicinus]
MEKSYFCDEQVEQMRVTYDAFVILKIAHDAGIDVKNRAIDFFRRYQGGQVEIFWRMVQLIFDDVEHIEEGYTDWGSESNTYRIPLPELKAFYPLLNADERVSFDRLFKEKLHHQDERFCEFEMKGHLAEDCFIITIEGDYGSYSPLLKVMVDIRNEVRALIRARRALLTSKLRGLMLLKMVHDRLGTVISTSLEDHLNVVFSRVMGQCGISLTLTPDDQLSFETMQSMLTNVLDQAVIQTNRGEVAA